MALTICKDEDKEEEERWKGRRDGGRERTHRQKSEKQKEKSGTATLMTTPVAMVCGMKMTTKKRHGR